MLMECYVDVSSDARHSKYYACGAAVGNHDQWDWFDMQWSHETHALKMPFRATDCEGGHGQFKNWPKPKRDALMGALVDIFLACKLFGVAAIVPVDEFRRSFPALRDRDAFFLAVTQVIMNMAHIANLAVFKAEMWFEQGPYNGMVHQVYDSVRALNWKPARSLGGIHFEGKKLRPLQAADLIARESFKHLDNLGVRKTRIPVRRMSDILCFMRWTEPALQRLAANGGPTNLMYLANLDAPDNAPQLVHFWKKSWAILEKEKPR